MHIKQCNPHKSQCQRFYYYYYLSLCFKTKRRFGRFWWSDLEHRLWTISCCLLHEAIACASASRRAAQNLGSSHLLWDHRLNPCLLSRATGSVSLNLSPSLLHMELRLSQSTVANDHQIRTASHSRGRLCLLMQSGMRVWSDVLQKLVLLKLVNNIVGYSPLIRHLWPLFESSFVSTTKL